MLVGFHFKSKREIIQMRKITLFLMVFAILTACVPVESAPTPQLEIEATISQPIPTAHAVTSPFSLEALRARAYGKGELSVEYAWENQSEFTRYYITYPSDNLTIHGFVNIPIGKGPFPVIIALHGFIPASEYKTRDYSTRYADALARNGYIVLHPNMRNFPPSDSVPRVSDFQGGYAIDVLNLLALVRKVASQEGIFKNADMSHLGIWGHSIGGGIALRVLSVEPEIKAAVLYAAVSQRYSDQTAGFKIYDYAASQAAFSLHHGDNDETISPSWTARLNQQILDAGKQVEYFTYPGQPHTFYGQNDALFMKRMIAFYDLNIIGED
jgi:dienelactone hydrolase